MAWKDVGEVEVLLNSFLTSAVGGGEWLFSGINDLRAMSRAEPIFFNEPLPPFEPPLLDQTLHCELLSRWFLFADCN
jgi:hypothetical protein